MQCNIQTYKNIVLLLLLSISDLFIKCDLLTSYPLIFLCVFCKKHRRIYAFIKGQQYRPTYFLFRPDTVCSCLVNVQLLFSVDAFSSIFPLLLSLNNNKKNAEIIWEILSTRARFDFTEAHIIFIYYFCVIFK